MADELEATAEQVQEVTPETTPATPADQIVNPSELPEELQPHFKRMQASYTRKMQGLSEERRKLQEQVTFADKLRTDPDFARQAILEAAPRLGINIQPNGNGNGHTDTSATAPAPPELVTAIKQKLSPELQWMAQSLADAHWTASRMTAAPMIEQQKQDQKARYSQEYDTAVQSLASRHPDWIEHEDEMTGVYQFLQSGALQHPVYGSLPDLLYSLVTKNSDAKRHAIQEMGRAARNRTGSSRTGTNTAPNLAEAVRKAPTTQDAWKLAAEAALAGLNQGR